MSRARQRRNKQRAAAAVQLRTALATTGTVPTDHSADLPVYAALTAVMMVSAYDPAGAVYEPWPGYPPPQQLAPARPGRPAWAMDTGQTYRISDALVGVVPPHGRAVAVRALGAARRSVAAEPFPAGFTPAPAPAPAEVPAAVPAVVPAAAAPRRRGGRLRQIADRVLHRAPLGRAA